jgi:hypothetical protein
MEEEICKNLLNAIEQFYSPASATQEEFAQREKTLRNYFADSQSWLPIVKLLSYPSTSQNAKLFLLTQLHKKLVFSFEIISQHESYGSVQELLIHLLQVESNIKLTKYCSKCLAIFILHTNNHYKENGCIEQIIKSLFINKDKIALSFLVLGVLKLSRTSLMPAMMIR